MSSTEKLRIPLETIISATNNFAETNKIGEGGFGRVYRGKSRKHGLLAIKRLNSNNGQGAHEYGMEVTLLSKYKHENLVSLIGFCGEGGEKIIVYKYEANQSLDKALYRKDLSWTVRLQICLGAARGLSYLHTGSGSQNGIIHRDIKSSNILLDENWNAKISDFGLSKITITNSPDSVVFSAACGTNGYIDPQILKDQMTQKSDVYSFGVVMYEVLFAKLVALVDDPHHFTIDKAKKHYEKKTLHMMIDPDLSDEMNFKSMSLFSTIAYECLKDVSEYRPTMAKVVEELERALEFQQVTSTRKSIGSSSSGYLYDVYISFKAGTEFIVNHILDALKKENLSSYLESSGGCNQRSAIKQSRSFIIIFSAHFDEDYCNLNEVQEIIKCVKERRNVVIPVFWNVHPSEVKIQNEYIDEAISKLKSAAVWRDSIIGVNYGYPLEASVFNKHSHGLAREAAGRLRFQLFGPKERKGNQLEGNERKGKKSQGNDAMVTMENPNYVYLPPIVPIHHLNPVSPSPYNNPYYPHPGPGVWFPHHSPSPYPSIHPPLPPQYVYYEEYFDNGNLQ